ncbi:MAG: DUF2500 family protein [Peptococcaceae bacterium]|nr:DUF2500 family protein [Peptococcaceae bacterium]
MTETIIIIILSVIAIILAASLIKQFAGENKEKLLAVLNDTGYESNEPPLEAHAKIISLSSVPRLVNGHRSRYLDYQTILFELDNGERIELEVSEYEYAKLWDNTTGTLYYHPDRFFDFKMDDTPENRARMFL